MKFKIFTYAAIVAAMFAATSCDDSREYPLAREGRVDLSSLGVTVKTLEGDNARKAAASRAEVDLNPFIVTIYSEAGAQVAQWTYAEMPEIFTLPVGHYRVEVESHELQKAAWNEPYYVGSSEFDIRDSQITEVEKITCTFGSLMVSVKFSPELREVLSADATVKVVANDEGELTFTPDDEGVRDGYFAVIDGSTTLAATFTGTVLGYPENIVKTFTDIKAGEHRTITFALKAVIIDPEQEVGTIDPGEGINVDVSMTDEDINGDVNTNEEPINDDDRPGNNQNFKNQIEMTYADATLNVAAPDGLRSLTLGLVTDNAALGTALAPVVGADLAAPGSAAAALASYGLPAADAVLGAKTLKLNLSDLLAVCADYEGSHQLTFTAIDANGQNATQTVDAPGKVVASAIEFESKLKFDTPVPALEQTDGLVVIKAPAGIAHLVLTIASTNDDFAGTTSALSGTDLAHPGDMAETFDSFGLDTGDKVLNHTEVNFDISSFFTLLGGFPGTHTFTIEVTDNDGNKASRSIILTV